MNPAIRHYAPRRIQRGTTLLIGLIMLVLLTLIGLASINMSTSNLKVVGNMQYQQEALAAAQDAINSVLSKGSYFSDPSTAPTSASVDINSDAAAEYTVALAQPCILATKNIPVSALSLSNADDLLCMSSTTLKNAGLMGQNTGAAQSDCAAVTWQLTASVNDASTKAKVVVVEAAQQRMDRILADAYKADPAKRCP